VHYQKLSDVTLPQPLGQRREIGRKRPTALHRLRIAITGHGSPMAFCSYINPGSIAMHLLSRR